MIPATIDIAKQDKLTIQTEDKSAAFYAAHVKNSASNNRKRPHTGSLNGSLGGGSSSGGPGIRAASNQPPFSKEHARAIDPTTLVMMQPPPQVMRI